MLEYSECVYHYVISRIQHIHSHLSPLAHLVSEVTLIWQLCCLWHSIRPGADGDDEADGGEWLLGLYVILRPPLRLVNDCLSRFYQRELTLSYWCPVHAEKRELYNSSAKTIATNWAMIASNRADPLASIAGATFPVPSPHCEGTVLKLIWTSYTCRYNNNQIWVLCAYMQDQNFKG